MSASRQKEFPFTLPLGYRDEDKNLHREVVIRKMTGKEEAVMAEPLYANNRGKLITELLYNCIIRLGDLSSVSRKDIARFYSPDRHFLLVKLCTITFGSEMESSYACPGCGTVNYTREDLNSLETKEWDEAGEVEIEVELEDGYEDKGEVYTEMVFRPPLGEDEEKVADLARKNIVRAKNSLLVRCLKKVGDMETQRFQALGTKIFEDLTLKDRRIIDDVLDEKMPGIDLTREIECVGCGRPFRASLDLENFLYPE